MDPTPERDEVAHQRRRLQDGLKHNLRLVMAKATIGLMAEGEEPAGLLEIGGRFGATQRDAGWRDGLTILTAMANILPHLAADDRPLALFHGMLHLASSVQGQRPHFDVGPLPGGETDLERLKAWLREFAEVRDRDGVERVVLSSLQANHDAKGLADMLFSAVTDHYFIGGGHSIDFVNKAFELLDVIGWQHSPEILVSVIPGITAGTRMEETSTWRTPVDLVGLLEPVFSDLLAGKFGDGHSDGRLADADFDALIARLMGDDPTAIIRALADLLVAGVALTELSLALSFAAALRVARFHLSNEFNDWVAVLHTFTSANATHRLLKRAPSLEGARAIWHSAMDLYLHRFLNAPAARQPSDTCVAGLPTGGDELLANLLELTDGRQRVEESAATTYRYLLGWPRRCPPARDPRKDPAARGWRVPLLSDARGRPRTLPRTSGPSARSRPDRAGGCRPLPGRPRPHRPGDHPDLPGRGPIAGERGADGGLKGLWGLRSPGKGREGRGASRERRGSYSGLRAPPSLRGSPNARP